jgi:SAM-dependent methyltransferase
LSIDGIFREKAAGRFFAPCELVTLDSRLSRYASSRRTRAGAESYATKYDRELGKRIASARERRCLRRMLHLTRLSSAHVLDAPCGAGRLTPLLLEVSARLVALDYSPAMLEVFGRSFAAPRLVGNALRLPFAAESFDLVVSVRLSHHVGTEADRIRHLGELMRVSRGFVIVTIFDTWSVKNVLRRLRRPWNQKPPKNTLSRAQVRETCQQTGFRPVRALPHSRLASGHVMYLLERESHARRVLDEVAGAEERPKRPAR